MSLLVFPIALPLLTAVILLLTLRLPLFQRWIAFISAIGLLGVAIAIFVEVEQKGIIVFQAGGWPAPFGITLVADLLASMLLVATGIVGVAVTATGFAGVDPKRESAGYHGLLHVLLMGVSGAFITGDLFNLYVWFEVMLVASFVLISLHRTRAQIEAAFQYVTLNLLASALFLTALGLLYGAAGTLNMADLASVLITRQATALELVLAMLFFTAFGVKAALFPLFFWLPASYHAPPPPIGAIFAGLLTKVGVYSLIRVFTLLFPNAPDGLYQLLLAQAICTMIIGLVGGFAQKNFRNVLAFNLVGHLGYSTVGLALMSPAVMGGSILYILHHIFVITNLYLVSGIFLKLYRTTNIAVLGSLYRNKPYVAVIAMIPIFSLAGVPPLSGFIGKLGLLRATFDVHAFWTSAVIMITGILTLLLMARLWADSFWKTAPQEAKMDIGTPMMLPIIFLSTVTLAITFLAEPMSQLTRRAADQLLNPEGYIHAVLKGNIRQ